MKLRISTTLLATVIALLLWIPASCLLNNLDSSLHPPNGAWWYAKGPNVAWGFFLLRLAHWPSYVFGACGLLVHTKLGTWGAPDGPLPCEFPLVLAVASGIGWGLLGMVVGTSVELIRKDAAKRGRRFYARRLAVAGIYLAFGSLVILALPHVLIANWARCLASEDTKTRLAAAQALARRAELILDLRHMGRYFPEPPASGYDAATVAEHARAAYDARLAIWSLRRALPALRTATHDSEMEVRRMACWAIGQSGVGLDRSLPALVSALGDPSESVRRDAVWLLGALGNESDPALPALLEAIEERKGPARTHAIEVLTYVGIRDPATTALLVELLDDRDPTVLHRALWALSRRRPLTDSDVRRFLSAFEDETAILRARRADGRLFSQEDFPQELPSRCISLVAEDQSPSVRARAAILLGELGAREAIPALEKAVDDNADEVRSAARRALEKFRKADSTPTANIP